jgi:uncharacterized protein YcfL
MKKLLFCITLTAMLAVGCGDTPQTTDAQSPQIMPTTAITEIATPTPAIATEATTPTPLVATETATEPVVASETQPEVATDTE